MHRLSSLILFVLLAACLSAQKSPHGDSFKVNCDDCHKTDGWKVDLKTIAFDHGGTKFPLTGQHRDVNCKDCHTSLVFDTAPLECNACHTDMHEQTVGNDCARCHTPVSWVVSNITQLHQRSRFPLVGPHKTADCRECHKNLLSATSPASPTASLLRFDPLGIECYDCHKDKYLATTNPNHTASNYSKNCTDCHNMNSFVWAGAGVNHNFFPLTAGHAVNDCYKCHKSGSFSGLSNECVSCHQPNYLSATNPNHTSLNFSTSCKDCHSTEPGWKPAEYKDHDARSFPIYSGKHNGEWNACSDCHTNTADYKQFTCVECHEHSNKAEVDKKHDGVPGYAFNNSACYGCHPTGSGQGTFDHVAAGFPLTGGHASVDCAKCHTGGLTRTSPLCSGCHTNKYNQTTNPNHTAKNISTDCANCHTTNPGWTPASFPTHNNYYKLEGAHLPIANECATCHNGNYTNSPNTCVGCHIANYNQSTKPSHSAAKFPTTCADCHTSAAWAPSTFNHSSVYPLIGAHATIAADCIQCHAKGYPNTPNTCAGCHQANYNQTTKPNHTTSKFPTTCQVCHSQTAWTPASFDHNTVYPLLGAHAAIAANCDQCHANGYPNTPNTCVGCHQANYNQTTKPNHTTSKFPTTCQVCHSQTAWTPASFDHNTVYPLLGAHAVIAANCDQCHANGFPNTPNTCAGCHQANYNQTTNPNHVTARFPLTCQDCHTQTVWSPSTFNHTTVYPLVGAHATVAANCLLCHTNGYPNTPNTCAGCHLTNYNQTTNPNHIAAQFSTACLNCHTQTAWAPATFDHNTVYPLIGAHATVATNCLLCHKNGYPNTPNTCVGCHQTNYNQTTNPNHVAGQFSTACQTCHSQTAWTPAAFDHNTVYPLIGAHATVATNCLLCHKNGYPNTPNTCAGCHQTNYNQTTNPNHVTSKFPITCLDCHTQTSWTPAAFDHNTVYPLIGAHATVATNCLLCHKNGYPNTPNTCAGCHQTNYNQTTNPNHVTSKFPITCLDCHTQTAWTPSTFNHSTVYPLVGAHATVAANCILCHTNGYPNTPNTCAGCHQADYNQTTNPNHVSAKFPLTCLDCHTQTAWSPSSFDHNTVYPLVGAHATIVKNCILCHANGYPNTPNTCAGCHQTNYNQTTNPNHVAAQFSTACLNCHTQTAWTPSSFDHNTVYPLQGAHATVVKNCVLCHANGYPNTPKTCSGCHLTNYNQTTNPNHVTAGFSTACESCHSQTAWVPSTFNHATIYPLTGAHASIAGNCLLCHPNGYSNTPNTCAGCHQKDFNQAANPNHTALGISNNCTTCHTTNPGWAPATFPTHNNYYVLAGAHVSQTCASCHNGNYTTTPNTCAGCHTTKYNQTTNPNHVAAQFPKTCAVCHSQTAWTPSTWNHTTYFPISSGRHTNISCVTCHTNASNYAVFTCVTSGCHAKAHNQNQGSAGCYKCHPQGKG